MNKLRKKDSNFELLQAVAREKVLVFFNKTNAIVKNQYNEGKVAIKMITTNTSKVNAYVAFCHLESKVNINDDEQAERVTKLKETLCSFENDIDDKDGFLLKKENETLKKLMADLITAIKAMKFTTNNGPTINLVNIADFIALENRFNQFLKGN